ncbi:Img2-domain-containing protein [Lojkania enalia]|uniref:Large ribosomal subunit protein mL49 n=1 Tax=Lojkania enalia TaxID=147567 RepID=A0A9P4K456_9PLEO|nr:Img2-domain-containing protein [Didymosphaeria enalia]
MASFKIVLPFLRPLAAPRASTSRQLFRFSTATRLRIDQFTNSNSSARVAPPSSTVPLKPSPKAPFTPADSSEAAEQASTEASTEADSAQSSAPKPILPSKLPNSGKPEKSKKPGKGANSTKSYKAEEDAATCRIEAPESEHKATKEEEKPSALELNISELGPARYYVERTRNKNLPIYSDYKRGGNLHLTIIKNITGDIEALRDEVQEFLNKKSKDVTVNTTTRHVIIKGFHMPEVRHILEKRGM